MNTETQTDPKADLRAQAKRTRSLLQLDAQGAKQLLDNFCKVLKSIQSSKLNIAFYYPVQREIDTLDLIDYALEQGHDVCLPITQESTRVMRFAQWDGVSDLTKGRYNILHPQIDDQTQWLVPDVICVPMLAFDRTGHRLGYGGGYYDATLASFHESEHHPITIGLAYAQQACLFPLPRGPHDVRLDYVVTQQCIHKYKD